MLVTCDNPSCDKILNRKPSHVLKNKKNFCSRKCRSQAAEHVATQICSQCKEPFPATLEYFNKGGRKNGLYSACKPCQKRVADNWYIANRAQHLATSKKYARAHPAMRRKAVRSYRLRNPEKRKIQQRESAAKRQLNGKAQQDYLRRKQSGKLSDARHRLLKKYPGIEKVYQSRHVQKLKSQGLTPSLRWKKNHPENYLNHSRVRTIGRQQMKANGVTAIGIYERDGGKCHLCHRKVPRSTFSLDHIIPKSKGGPGTWENLALAHLRCNIKRGVDRIPAQYRLF